MSRSDGTRGPGRPRSQEAHRAILDATLELLGEVGWGGLTVEGIARRAEVGKATIYRRWSGLEEVLTAAVEGLVREIEIPDTGSVREDLLALLRRAVALYRGPAGRLMPGLVSAMARHPEVAVAVREGFLAERRAALAQVVERGIDRGELRPDADLELALDFLGGPLFYRLLVTGGPLDDDLAAGTVDVMLRGMAATAGVAPTGSARGQGNGTTGTETRAEDGGR